MTTRPASALDRLALAAALAGIGVAGYLTVVHYLEVDPVCAGGSSGCHVVQASRYADLAGIPVAVLGLAGYVLITASLLTRGETARLVAAGLALGGAGFSLYLTYLELFVIDAICQWCIASAVLMTALAPITVARLLRAPPV